MSETKYELRLPTKAELDELKRLYGESFGERARRAFAACWSWKYWSISGQDKINYCIATAEHGVVGQCGLMPLALWWSNREVKAAFITDFFVVSSSRQKGVGKRLVQITNHDGLDVCLGFGLTAASYGLLQRIEWHGLGEVPSFVCVLKRWKVASDMLKPGPRLLARYALLAWRGLRMVWNAVRYHPGVLSSSEVQVQRTDSISSEYDDLWIRCRSGYKVCAKRDARYMRWRYFGMTSRPYTVWEARKQKHLVGFASSRLDDSGEGLRGVLVDVFTHPSDRLARHSLIMAVMQDFRNAGAKLVITVALNRDLIKSLRWAGFLQGNKGPKLCVETGIPDMDPVSNTGSWHLTLADSDLDVPS